MQYKLDNSQTHCSEIQPGNSTKGHTFKCYTTFSQVRAKRGKMLALLCKMPFLMLVLLNYVCFFHEVHAFIYTLCLESQGFLLISSLKGLN